MGMHLKQQHRRSYLQERLANDLNIRLNKKPDAFEQPDTTVHNQEETVSFRWAWFAVLTSGGVVAILLALLQREDPQVIGAGLNGTLLGIAGIACIVGGCLALVIGRPGKPKSSQN